MHVCMAMSLSGDQSETPHPFPPQHTQTHTCIQHCQAAAAHTGHAAAAVALCDGALHTHGVRELGLLGGGVCECCECVRCV